MPKKKKSLTNPIRPASLAITIETLLGSLASEFEQGLVYLEAGASLGTFARLIGLSPETVKKWVKLGSGSSPVHPYDTFANRVLKAVSTARLLAETDIKAKNPAHWLKVVGATIDDDWAVPDKVSVEHSVRMVPVDATTVQKALDLLAQAGVDISAYEPSSLDEEVQDDDPEITGRIIDVGNPSMPDRLQKFVGATRQRLHAGETPDVV